MSVPRKILGKLIENVCASSEKTNSDWYFTRTKMCSVEWSACVGMNRKYADEAVSVLSAKIFRYGVLKVKRRRN